MLRVTGISQPWHTNCKAKNSGCLKTSVYCDLMGLTLQNVLGLFSKLLLERLPAGYSPYLMREYHAIDFVALLLSYSNIFVVIGNRTYLSTLYSGYSSLFTSPSMVNSPNGSVFFAGYGLAHDQLYSLYHCTFSSSACFRPSSNTQ